MWPALLAILLMGAAADGSSTDDLRSQVNRFVQQLSSSELNKRAEAEEQLLALGPQVLELLPTFSDQTPATEAQKRETVARIRQRLEHELAERSTQASTITLHRSGTLSQILPELTRQSGNKIKDLRSQMGQVQTDPTVTVDFDKTPFWQALDKTLDQANLTLYHFSANDALGIIARGEKQLPRSGRASYAGPLRIEATRLTAERDLRGVGADSSLKLMLEIAWEPRMRPITLQQPLGEIHALDDRGEVVRVDGAGGELEKAIDAVGTAAEFQIPLVNPPRGARTIASVKGKLRALLPGKIESFEFTGLKNAKKVEQHKAGVTVTLDEVRHNNDAWEVRMRVRFDKAANALESFRSWIYNNEAYLVGPDGKRISHAGFETTRQTQDEVGVAYLFDLPNGPDGLTFVYNTPAMLNSIPLEYELKDLPLP
jgi:hypothetical protein